MEYKVEYRNGMWYAKKHNLATGSKTHRRFFYREDAENQIKKWQA